MRRRAVTLVTLAIFAAVATAAWALGGAVAPREPEVEAGPAPVSAALQLGDTSCVTCHFDTELFEPEEIALIEGFHDDVHASVGLSCHDCHGGNPDPALAEDYVGAKDEDFVASPYRGRPGAADIPAFCGECHSSAAYMRRFSPSPRVDQESEYWTSQHGQGLASGDTNVATCISCHSTHGVRRIAESESPVYPTRVAETCSSCHADVERMSGYTLPGGRPLPVDQHARWRESVHAEAMFDKEDLTAPTCNDCHGNHGASPPGLDSVAFVCGQCHGREADIFRRSPKRAGFEAHNDYLADAEGEGCVACHDLPEPAALLTDFGSFGECAACHGNHGVVRPTLSFLSPLPDAPCAFCHPAGPGIHFPEPEEHIVEFDAMLDELLAEATQAGFEGEERFDWLVDRAQELPQHTLGPGADGRPIRRAEFDELFTKFRIGKTSFTYEDPATGETVRAPIRRCASCHAGEEILGDDALGIRVAGNLLGHMQELTSLTAAAERVLLAARRGGVETGEAGLEVERAIDAQIGLEVLLHAFDTSAESEFMTAHGDGMVRAEAALAAGDEALGELLFRRRGLVVALGLILLVLIGLALKINEVSAREDRPSSADL